MVYISLTLIFYRLRQQPNHHEQSLKINLNSVIFVIDCSPCHLERYIHSWGKLHFSPRRGSQILCLQVDAKLWTILCILIRICPFPGLHRIRTRWTVHQVEDTIRRRVDISVTCRYSVGVDIYGRRAYSLPCRWRSKQRHPNFERQRHSSNAYDSVTNDSGLRFSAENSHES